MKYNQKVAGCMLCGESFDTWDDASEHAKQGISILLRLKHLAHPELTYCRFPVVKSYE